MLHDADHQLGVVAEHLSREVEVTRRVPPCWDQKGEDVVHVIRGRGEEEGKQKKRGLSAFTKSTPNQASSATDFVSFAGDAPTHLHPYRRPLGLEKNPPPRPRHI